MIDSCVRRRTSSPANSTAPPEASYMRGVRYSTVVLPAPDGPTNATCWPGLGGERDAPKGRPRVGRGIRIAEDHVAELDAPDRARRRRPTGIASGASLIAGTRSRYSKMRAKSAPEVCRSSATRMSPISGISSRACTVVKATIGSRGDRVGAAGDQVARHQVDDGRHARHQHLDDREEALAAHRPSHLQTHLVDVLGAVAGRLGALPVERLRQQDARDAQRLLGDRR